MFSGKIFAVSVLAVVLFAGCVSPDSNLKGPFSESEIISPESDSVPEVQGEQAQASQSSSGSEQDSSEPAVPSVGLPHEHVEEPAPSALEIAANPPGLPDTEMLLPEEEMLSGEEEEFVLEEGSEGLAEEDVYVLKLQECNLMTDQSLKNNCLYDLALQDKNPSFCDGIFDYMMQENCRVLASENPDCNMISDSVARDACIIDQAVSEENAELCEQIADDFMKSVCVSAVEDLFPEE
ncbi:MAG: hypothetical protein J7K00_02895 [Candidatus Diapherotrites archaeon]|nr:hypothetical protein [Candidatus Diapherotrites archaeon]